MPKPWGGPPSHHSPEARAQIRERAEYFLRVHRPLGHRDEPSPEPGAEEQKWVQMLADLDAGRPVQGVAHWLNHDLAFQWGWPEDAPIVIHPDGRVELLR